MPPKTSIRIANIQITDFVIKVKDPALQALIPKTLIPQRMTFELHGVDNSIANGLRRTIGGELLVSALYCEPTDIKTTDPFIIPEMVQKRLRMIPIDQKTPLNATFELYAENHNMYVRDVKLSELNAKKSPFNETTTLCTLEAGKVLTIKNIGIHQAYGFVEGDGMHVVAVNCSSLALNFDPVNSFKHAGDSVRTNNIQAWQISFNTNGTMGCKEIVRAACESIIERMKSVALLYDMIENNMDEYVLHINGESDTIGNLFMRAVDKLYPDIRAVTYTTAPDSRLLTLRIRTDEDIKKVLNSAISHVTAIYEVIGESF